MISSFAMHDWLTITIVFLIALLVLVQFFDKKRFIRLVSFIKQKEYFADYNYKKVSLISLFNITIFVFQLVVYALFFYLILLHLEIITDSFSSFYKITLAFFLFYTAKVIILRILANIFSIDSIYFFISFERFTYSSKIAIYLFPFVILIAYMFYYNSLLTKVNIAFFAIVSLYFFIKMLWNNQKLIFYNFLYFILYLCALEITPLVYLFKSIIS